MRDRFTDYSSYYNALYLESELYLYSEYGRLNGFNGLYSGVPTIVEVKKYQAMDSALATAAPLSHKTFDTA